MIQSSVIRKMTVQDIPVVSSLDLNVDPAPWSEKLYNDCLGIGYECWVITADSDVIGFGISNYAGPEAHLLKLAIDPKFHRQGFGQKLLQHFINLAKTQGAEEMYLEVRVSNDPAIKLYAKNNFVEVGVRKDYYPPNERLAIPKEDALTMALALL